MRKEDGTSGALLISMAKPAIYLDHNATTALFPEARDAVVSALAMTGNPVSVHAHGRRLRALVEAARDRVAEAAGALRAEVVFTGSATEALTQAIVGGARAFAVDEVVVSAVEHKSVLNAAEMAGVPVSVLPVNSAGQVLAQSVAEKVQQLSAAGKTGLFAIQMVNNETGIIQPLNEIEAVLGPTPHVLVVDAVQAFGKLALDFSARAADMMAITAHKIGGPAGVGALLMKPHCDQVRLLPGGGQEMGRRAGTEAWPLIAGFGAAVDAAGAGYDGKRVARLAAELEAGLLELAPDAAIFGADVARVGNVTFFAVPGLKNSVAMMGLDLEGVSVSTGSACTSGKVAPSHVLEAMGIDKALALGGVRVSLGWSTTQEDVVGFLAAFETVLARHRKQVERAA